MKLIRKKGATDQTILVFIQDSASTTGGGKTGIAYNASGLVCYYVRPGSAAAQLTLATQTVTGAHSDGGFVEIDATNMPGVYRLDLSDAILATGVDSVVLMLKGATGMAPLPIEIQLTDFDLGTATQKVDVDTIKTQAVTCGAGITVSPYVGNATAAIGVDANGYVTANMNGDFTATQKSSITAAVPTAAAIGTDAASKVLVTPAQKLVTDANGYVTYANAAPPSAADIKTAIEAAGSSIAQILEDTGLLDDADGGLADIHTVVNGIKTKTDSLNFTVAGQVDANIQSINDTTVNGDGSTTPWGP